MTTRGNPTVQIRLPREDRARWEAAARHEGQSLAEWVRDCCERALRGRYDPANEPELDVFAHPDGTPHSVDGRMGCLGCANLRREALHRSD